MIHRSHKSTTRYSIAGQVDALREARELVEREIVRSGEVILQPYDQYCADMQHAADIASQWLLHRIARDRAAWPSAQDYIDWLISYLEEGDPDDE